MPARPRFVSSVCAFFLLVTHRCSSLNLQETLSGRDSIVDEHRAAAKATISKRRAIEKMKSSASIKGDRVDEALDELDEVRFVSPPSPAAVAAR